MKLFGCSVGARGLISEPPFRSPPSIIDTHLRGKAAVSLILTEYFKWEKKEKKKGGEQ